MAVLRKIFFPTDSENRVSHKVLALVFTTLFVITIGAGGASYYFYDQYRKTQQMVKNPEEASQKELKKILDNIAKFMELPGGEQPSVASVVDKEKLKDQPFFAKAENGDKVIIYTQAKKAILYRPKTNKVIDVTVVNVGSDALKADGEGKSLKTRVALYNGTTINGLTRSAEKRLKDKLNEVEITARENAKKDTYQKTLVIPLSEKFKEAALQLIQALGVGQQAKLPEGEEKFDTDVIVILGTDYKE